MKIGFMQCALLVTLQLALTQPMHANRFTDWCSDTWNGFKGGVGRLFGSNKRVYDKKSSYEVNSPAGTVSVETTQREVIKNKQK